LLFENLAVLFDVLLGHAASLWTARGSAAFACDAA
jgi:hypothetical protein